MKSKRGTSGPFTLYQKMMGCTYLGHHHFGNTFLKANKVKFKYVNILRKMAAPTSVPRLNPIIALHKTHFQQQGLDYWVYIWIEWQSEFYLWSKGAFFSSPFRGCSSNLPDIGLRESGDPVVYSRWDCNRGGEWVTHRNCLLPLASRTATQELLYSMF